MARRHKKKKPAAEAKKHEAVAAVVEEAPAPEPPPPVFVPSAPRAQAAWWGFWAALALGIFWVLGHAFVVDQVTVRLCNQADANIPDPQARPPLFLSPMAFDGYVWNRHAEYLGRNGELRLRKTDFDNAPHGREVHWNSAFAWYLRALGELHRAFSGNSLRNSISRMSIWANPLLLCVLLVVFGVLAARRFGPLSGVVVVIGMVTTPSFYEGFLPGYPDHHGLIGMALLGLIFGLAWAGGGWVQAADGPGLVAPRSLAQARTGIWISAVSGAVALWLSALSSVIAVGAVGIGVLVAALLFSDAARRVGSVFHVSLLKTWAVVGAAGSFLFYLAEYFPWHVSMRLEVNHPLYSLAWLGGGWGLAILCEWLAAPPAQRPVFPWKRLVIPALACMPLPLAIAWGGPAVYIPSDPFMGRLWKNIAELLPLLLRIQLGTLTWQSALGFYPLLILAGVVLLCLRQVHGVSKLVIVQMAVPILIITGLQFYQTRWGMLAGPFYIGLAGLVVPILWRVVRGHGLATPLAAGAIAIYAAVLGFPAFSGWILPFVRQYLAGEKPPVDPQQALHLLHRDMVKAIRANAAGRPVTLLSSPNSSCILAALGDFRTLGTLYWENVEGLKSAALALNAQSDQEALQRLRDHGVTHVAMMTWENFIEPYFHILYPQPVEGKSIQNSFGIRALFKGQLPLWARPLPFPPHPFAKALQQKVLILEIVPEQTEPEAKMHLARYLRISEENPSQAEPFARQAVEGMPGSFEARRELAAVLISQGRTAEGVRQLVESLPLAPKESLSPSLADFFQALVRRGAIGDAIHLAKAFADQPQSPPEVLLDGAWALATVGDPSLRDSATAREFLKRAGDSSASAGHLALVEAAIEAAEGRFPRAAELARKAVEEFEKAGNATMAKRAQTVAEAYVRGELWKP